MYHGTHQDSVQSILSKGFMPSLEGMLGSGVYLTRDVENARLYPRFILDSQRAVIEVTVLLICI